jgi:CheY-like chemotaxis protein
MGRKILTDAGYDVVTVNNGSAALKRVAEVKPDLIVLDVYMPGYSGLEVCQRLKDAGETSQIPVLLTVGKLEPFKPEEGRRVRADSYIVKPFEASELLTAITKLEDRLAPEQSSGEDRVGNKATEHKGDPESGWKNRLSFSSKKKKEEPEPSAEEASSASFRDFRKTKSKTGANGSAVEKIEKIPVAVLPQPEPVPDVPRDITPEEMDALSALATKLDGEMHASKPAAKPEVDVTSSPVEAKTIDAPAATIEHSTHPAEAPAFAVERVHDEIVAAKTEVEIPVECVEPPAEGIAVIAELAVREAGQHEAQHSVANAPEAPADIPVVFEVNTSLLTQEPAPVDRNDEPTFASFMGMVEQPAQEEEKVEVQVEEKPSKTVASSSKTDEVVAETSSEAPPVEANAEPTPAADPTGSKEASEAAPSDAELFEALRLLTPATGSADMAPSPQSLAAAGQLLAEEAMRDAASGPRWVAEPITLSPEEGAISLEAEMMQTLAAPAAPTAADAEAGRITGVAAIAAAVETRLAEAQSTVMGKYLAEHSAEQPVEQAIEQASAGQPAEIRTEISSEPPVEMIASSSESANGEPNNGAGPSVAPAERGTKDAPKAMAAAAAAETSASATDASTIASIVDSVMADLRPRIVEEIAKKLAKKN